MNHIGYSRYDEPDYFYDSADLYKDCEKEEVRGALNAIFDIVYGDREIEDLEYELEQLAWMFDMKLPSKPFNLTRIRGE